MTYLLVAFLIAILLPLFTGTWRMSLLGLSLQGLLMGAMALRHPPEHWEVAGLLFIDLFVVRSMFVPRYLYGIQRANNAPRRNDVLPANLLLWTAAGALVFAAFQFSERVAPATDELRMHVAVAASALLVSLLVLGTARSTFSQIIGLLRLENAIVMLELASSHHLPLAIQASVLVAYVLTAVVLGAFLRGLAQTSEAASSEEGPTL
jgi:hydrogenase-4 membrane subunit HyfE